MQGVAKANTSPESSALQIILNNLYVDDLLCSVPNDEKAVELRQKVQQALDAGGFHLHKWLSTSKIVVESIPETDRASNTTVVLQGPNEVNTPMLVKTLGVAWSATNDNFTFNYTEPEITKFTKRTVLSKTASIFDPPGQVSPYTIRAKVLLAAIRLRLPVAHKN